jgi:ankyrin repeat protein
MLTPIELKNYFSESLEKDIQAGLDINQPMFSTYPIIYYACKHNDEKAVNLLLDNGALIDFKDESSDSSPLYYAAKNGMLDAVTKMSRLAPAHIDHTNRHRKTPFMIAANQGHLPVMKFLAAQGADIFREDHKKRNSFYFTCLHNHADAARWLLEQGLDINTATPGGVTALDRALSGRSIERTSLLALFLHYQDQLKGENKEKFNLIRLSILFPSAN